jgi:hypothetical protein
MMLLKGDYVSMARPVWISQGKDPSTNGVLGFLDRNCYPTPPLMGAWLTMAVEIHNKGFRPHPVSGTLPSAMDEVQHLRN